MFFHKFRFRPARIILPAALAVLILSARTGYSFTALYAFGDSLTDTGRNPPGAQYYEGRYSNGPLWIEYLSAMLGIPYNASNNLAYSGSTTSDLLSQIAEMPSTNNLQSALFAVWSGGNDFLQSTGNGTNDAEWGATISNAVLNLTNAANVLYTIGAREVIVPNMVYLGELPYFSTTGGFTNYINFQVQLFNSELGTAVTNLMKACPGLRIYSMNANQEGLTVYDSPAAYGFTVISVGALEDTNLTNKSFTGPGANYLFWDYIHPTTKMHANFGALAFNLVGVGLNVSGSASNLSLTVSNLYPGFQYSIQGSTNLSAWTNYETITANGTNFNIHVTNSPGRAAYYRVVY